MIVLLCAILTLVLIYCSSYDIDLIEFMMIIACFLAMIKVLSLPTLPRCRELFENAWNTIDVPAFSKLAELPKEVGEMIKKPIERMTAAANTGDESPVDNQESIETDRYVETEDTYVGSIQLVTEKDNMGNDVTEPKFVIEESKFEQLKVEYKRFDALLNLLREASPRIHGIIVPPIVTTEEEQ